MIDPACGSGNFLIISYKELCKLEIKLLQILNQDNNLASLTGEDGFVMATQSSVTLNNFYGIEIDDFASQIARLSLYLAQHQVNLEFEKEFGKLKPILPLRESGNIECGNATRIDWENVCPKVEYGIDKKTILKEYEIYVISNPPYYGARKQDNEQKEDINRIFNGVKSANNLDYISCWFLLGKNYIQGTKIKVAFVSTNSISQGEQVSILWPLILKDKIEIDFAYQSFKWKNSAKGNAGVTCVIVGLRSESKNPKYIFSDKIKILAKNVSPYLVEGKNIFIQKRSKPISALPEMSFGSMANDDGNFLLSREERDSLIQTNPAAIKYIKKAVGGIEFIDRIEKYCIWIRDENYKEAIQIPEILNRINKISSYRQRSPREATRELANKPYRFGEIRHEDIPKIVIPATSSEKRVYIPIGFLEKDTVVTNATNAVHTKENWIFAVLNSRMHMVWIRFVCGSLETRIRYSASLGYNTFPFPNITSKQKESLTSHVYNILGEREKYPEKTMADLYDPDKMPDGLREAHKYLDLAIDQVYRSKPFESDEDRLAHLFKLYEEMIIK